MSRRTDRSKLIQLFYQMDMLGEFEVPKGQDKALNDYQKQVISTFILHRQVLDAKIEQTLVDWTIDRIAKTDLACIRVALTEIIYIDSIPFKVAINEAVEMAKLFGDDDSPKFINGVLRAFQQ